MDNPAALTPAALTLAFLEYRPRSAARVIEELDPADGAAFLETVPSRIGAPVVGFMAPWAAARCLDLLPAPLAAGLVRNMTYQDGTTLLRLVAKDRRARILEQVPRRLARDFANSLTYPVGSVGAWMDHDLPVFAPDSTVSDGLKFAKQRRGRRDHHIFVADERREFAGAVSVSELVASQPGTKLARIMRRGIRPLSNRATLSSVADLALWDGFPMLPVIGRRKQILGGLSRSSVREGLSEERAFAPGFDPDSIPAHLLLSYFATCAGLLRLVSPPGHPKQNRTE